MSVGSGSSSSSGAEPLSESGVPAAVTQLEGRRGWANEQAAASLLLARCFALCRLLRVRHSGREEP